jgi:hypothetical protein
VAWWSTIDRSYVVREVGVHDNDEISGNEVEAVDIGSPGRVMRGSRELGTYATHPRPSFPARGLRTYSRRYK